MLVNSTQYIHPSLHCYLYRVPAPPAEDRPFRSNLCRHQRQATQRRAGLCRRIPLYLRQYRVGKLHQPHILLKLRHLRTSRAQRFIQHKKDALQRLRITIRVSRMAQLRVSRHQLRSRFRHQRVRRLFVVHPQDRCRKPLYGKIPQIPHQYTYSFQSLSHDILFFPFVIHYVREDRRSRRFLSL